MHVYANNYIIIIFVCNATVFGLSVPDGLYPNGKVRPDWWKKIVSTTGNCDLDDGEALNRVELSGKLVLLFDILRECCSIGDKVLVSSSGQEQLQLVENVMSLSSSCAIYNNNIP